jgi:hypothetical protein
VDKGAIRGGMIEGSALTKASTTRLANTHMQCPARPRRRATWQTPAPAAHPGVRHIRSSGQGPYRCVQHTIIHCALQLPPDFWPLAEPPKRMARSPAAFAYLVRAAVYDLATSPTAAVKTPAH